jgi:hypothetical protein
MMHRRRGENTTGCGHEKAQTPERLEKTNYSVSGRQCGLGCEGWLVVWSGDGLVFHEARENEIERGDAFRSVNAAASRAEDQHG